MRNPLCMLDCEAILQSGGGSRVVAIAQTQYIERFRTQKKFFKTYAGNYERDGLRFYDTLTGPIPRHVNTLLSPSCAQNVVVAGMGFLVVRRDGSMQEKRPNFAF